MPERPSVPLEPLAAPIRATTTENIQLPRIYWAFRTPPFGHDAWFAGQLLASHLADGKSSPIYRDLVWDRQIAQDAGAHLYPTEEAGIFLVWATAKPGVDPDRLAEVVRQLLVRARQPVPEPDLQRARKQSLIGLMSGLETLDARADRLSMYATLFDHPDGAFEENARVAALSPADLAQFAEDHLKLDGAVELTVRPESAP